MISVLPKEWASGLCLAVALLLGLAVPAAGQAVMPGVDLNSPTMTTAEMSREEVAAAIEAAAGAPISLVRKRLSGLDLSGLDLTGANLRGAYLNKTNFRLAKLDNAVLDQAWTLNANFEGASFRHASLIASQMHGANLKGADLTGARITA
ncbi:MAG: pentapeptide repeat-containing protein, partial [Pseudomonadota bacterium]|nr:pentapeptide repeat-containing protein [Pseudomonadota bacterium]